MVTHIFTVFPACKMPTTCRNTPLVILGKEDKHFLKERKQVIKNMSLLPYLCEIVKKLVATLVHIFNLVNSLICPTLVFE